MINGLELISLNLGISFENLLLLVVSLGCIIFAAKGVQIALLIEAVFSMSIFVFTYETGRNYAPSLSVFLICFVLLCLTLYISQKTSPSGGIAP